MSAPTYPKPRLLGEIVAQQHAVIEASAGTGKTFTIEHLVAELVLRGVDLGKILVVTFTERAAGELRSRIRALLWKLATRTESKAPRPGEDAWEIGPHELERLLQALARVDTATFSTIHSFCQRLLTENAFVHKRLFSQRLVDGRTLFGDVFRDFVRENLAVGAPLERLLRPAFTGTAFDEDGTLNALEKGLYDAVRTSSPLRPSLDEGAVRLALAVLVRDLPGAIAGSGGHEALRATLEIAREALGLHDQAFWVRLAAMHGRSPTNKARTILTQLEDKTIQKAASDDLKAALVTLAHHVATLRGLLLIRGAPELRRRMRDEKRAEGLYDFDDMLSVLASSLEEAGDEAVTGLRARYSHVLIDEFQDTDPVQWAIFRRLFVAGESPTRLYLIGDPKQAIYGFRSADVGTYIAARDELCVAHGPFRLRQNFRSSARMIDAYNEVFTGVADFFGVESGISYTREEAVECGAPVTRLLDPSGAEVVPLHILVADGATGVSRDAVIPGTARFVAAEIRRLVGTHVLVTAEHPTGRPLRPGDIYVLVGARKDGAIVMEALADARVPHAPYKLEGLFETDEVGDLLTVLRGVVDPFDHPARLEALLTPFFELWPGEAEPLRDASDEAPQIRQLLRWHDLAARRDYPGLFASLLEETGYARRAALVPAFRPCVANVQRALSMLQLEARRRQPTVDELVDTLAAWRRGDSLPESPDAGLQPATTDGSAVQVMTMHASKGLEAAVVFLVGGLTTRNFSDLADYRDASRQRLRWAGGKAPADVKARIRSNLDEERRRLGYVALTRAKGLLYAAVYRDDVGKPERIDGPYEHLHARLAALVTGDMDPSLFAVTPLDLATEAPSARAADVLAGWRPGADLRADRPEAGAPSPRAHLGAVVTSYSGITRHLARPDETEKGAFTGETNRVEVPKDQLPTSNVVGSFLHDALEALDLRHVARLTSREAFAADVAVRGVVEPLADEAGIESVHRAHAYRLLHAGLHTPLAGPWREPPAIAQLGKVQREAEFLFPIPERSHRLLDATMSGDGAPFKVERGLLRGFIDVVFEHEERLCVVDWKSSVLRTSTPDALDRYVHAHFDWQIVVYGVAALRMLGVRDERDYERRFGGIYYLFLRDMESGASSDGAPGVWFHRPSWDEAVRWERRLLEHGYGRTEAP